MQWGKNAIVSPVELRFGCGNCNSEKIYDRMEKRKEEIIHGAKQTAFGAGAVAWWWWWWSWWCAHANNVIFPMGLQEPIAHHLNTNNRNMCVMYTLQLYTILLFDVCIAASEREEERDRYMEIMPSASDLFHIDLWLALLFICSALLNLLLRSLFRSGMKTEEEQGRKAKRSTKLPRQTNREIKCLVHANLYYTNTHREIP